MKYLLRNWMVLPLVLLCLWPALAVGQNLTGTYALYQKGKESKGVVGYMRITRQQGNSFSIGNASPTGNPAYDWTGQGSINGNSGYYTWRFEDGKTGKTTFTVDNAGNLHGQVWGSGVNWGYIARKQ